MGELPTVRQREAVHMAGQGLKNREIATAMKITEYTVVQHMVRAFQALGVHTRRDAFARLTELENLL